MSPGPVRPLSALVLFFLLAPFAFPQNTRLPYRPIAAQWALNRIVMVSTGPNQLHLFDPATHTTESIALNAAPVSLSISPNGLFAAVGHAGSASYVNLTTRLVTRTYTYPTSPFPPAEVILGADTLYVLPKAGSAYPYAIRLDTGSDTTPGYYTASGASLHPNGSAIFAMSESERPGNVLRLATEPPGILQPPQTVTPAAGDFCGQVWYSPNGARLYSRCGSTATFPPAPQEPLSFAGRFSPTPVQAFAESLTQRIAFVPATADSANQILLLNSTNYAEIGRLALPTFTTGGRTFQGQGRHLFFQLDANGATSLTAIYQADPASGILNDFAIHTYALSPPAICTATFSAAALSIPSEGALRTVNVQAAPECVYSAASSASWVQIVSGGTGSGNSALRLHIQANTASQARTATVTLGPQSLTITQAAAPATVPAQFSLSYNVVDAAYSRPLDRIILVTSSPDELHLLDPVTGSDQFLNLPYPPQSIGLSPDGLKAAVGHAGFVSIINLQARALDRFVPSALDSHAVLLSTEPWLYTMSTRGGRLLNIFTGASPNFAYLGYPPLYRLNIDGADPSVTPIGISTPCPAFWSSQDDTRLFNACGAVLRSSLNPNEDGALVNATSPASAAPGPPPGSPTPPCANSPLPSSLPPPIPKSNSTATTLFRCAAASPSLRVPATHRFPPAAAGSSGTGPPTNSTPSPNSTSPASPCRRPPHSRSSLSKPSPCPASTPAPIPSTPSTSPPSPPEPASPSLSRRNPPAPGPLFSPRTGSASLSTARRSASIRAPAPAHLPSSPKPMPVTSRALPTSLLPASP